MQHSFLLIQGPLAGISSAPFRRLANIYGEPDFCCTEMISAKHLVHHYEDQYRYIVKDKDEGKLCYQISGNEGDILQRATGILNSIGANYIDLNCGCPKPKIRKKGVGSKLLENSTHLARLLKAIKSEADCPVSLKIRIDGKSGEEYTQSVIDAAHAAHVDFIVIHARHWLEGYTVEPHYEQLSRWVKYADIPVIGNGDVSDLRSLEKIRLTGCAGVMISRAGVGQPWLTKQLKRQSTRAHFECPSIPEIGELFLEHIQNLVQLDGEFKSCLSARKLGKYYNRGRVSDEFNHQLKSVQKLSEIEGLIHEYFR